MARSRRTAVTTITTMNVSPSTLMWTFASVAVLSAVVGWVGYLRAIPKHTVPKLPVAMMITQSLALALAMGVVEEALRTGARPLGAFVLAGLAVVLALFFWGLYSQRHTPLGTLQVALGEPMIPFESVDSNGAVVHSSDFAGQRLLLKFFRGSW